MTKIQYTILLLSVTLCWSTEMILLKNIPSEVPTFAVLTMTNGIGSLILGSIFFKHIRRVCSKRLLLYALSLAIMNISYNTLIIYSLHFLNSSTASFIISMTIAILPIMLFIMGRKVTKSNVLGIIVIVLGLLFASEIEVNKDSILGIGVMLTACVIRALYLIKTNDYAKISDSAALTVSTISIVSIISFFLWFVIRPKTFFSLNYSKAMLSSIFSDGYFICAYAVLLNMIAQKYASPASCSSIYALQIIFSAILAAIIPDILGTAVPFTLIRVIGCITIVFGTMISELDLLSILNKRINKGEFKI